MRLLPCGDAAILLDEVPDPIALYDALRADPPPGLTDLVPAASTVLVRIDPRQVSLETVAAHLRRVRPGPGRKPDVDEVVLGVRYDGPDLADVAEHVGISEDELVGLHTEAEWTVAFVGFAPGFGYLVGGDARLHVPRRREPRTAVPAGSVGLAGVYSGVYPRSSPGGWQLIGRTDPDPLWDPGREPPALLSVGVRVRFQDVT